MKRYIISLDQGTTSSRAVIFDDQAQIKELVQKEFKQIYPQPGWVEHDPMEIYASQYAVLMEAVAKSGIESREIAAIGITNQRETTIVWDRRTGKPVYNAIVWQCRRTADIVEKIRADGLADYIQQTTGLIPDAYFSATKIKWILDHVEGARKLAEEGHLLCGTVDTWLIWKLTEGKVFATDYTNASRTMLYNIRTLQWDSRLCDYFACLEKVFSLCFAYLFDDVGYSVLISFDEIHFYPP
jgi:glycerol kinase